MESALKVRDVKNVLVRRDTLIAPLPGAGFGRAATQAFGLGHNRSACWAERRRGAYVAFCRT